MKPISACSRSAIVSGMRPPSDEADYSLTSTGRPGLNLGPKLVGQGAEVARPAVLGFAQDERQVVVVVAAQDIAGEGQRVAHLGREALGDALAVSARLPARHVPYRAPPPRRPVERFADLQGAPRRLIAGKVGGGDD